MIWCVAGEEYRLKDKTKFKAIGNYLRQIDGMEHLRTIHGWGGELGKEPSVDFILANAWEPPARMREVMLKEFRSSGLPYAMTESRYDGIEPGPRYRSRSYAWEAMAAGAMGYTYGADGIWDWGTYFPQFPDPLARLDISSAYEMKVFADFFAGIEWWKLTPAEGIASRGRILLEQEKQYLVWLADGGSFSLDLPARQRQFSAIWLDPVHRKKITFTESLRAVNRPSRRRLPAMRYFTLRLTTTKARAGETFPCDQLFLKYRRRCGSTLALPAVLVRRKRQTPAAHRRDAPEFSAAFLKARNRRVPLPRSRLLRPDDCAE